MRSEVWVHTIASHIENQQSGLRLRTELLGLAGANILLIDDNDDVRVLMQMVLERAGYLVNTAADGPEALQQLSSFDPDLVLLDIKMPGVDGLTVCRHIRETSEVPVIMLTALNDEEKMVRAMELGADGYIVKGMSMSELLARVESMLRRGNMSPARPIFEPLPALMN